MIQFNAQTRPVSLGYPQAETAPPYFSGLTSVDAVRFKGNASRRTGIVASLGSASTSPDVIRRMVLAGADVFRIDFAKGTHEEHAQTVGSVRQVVKDLEESGVLKRPVRLMADLQGPRLAVGKLSANGRRLKEGSTVKLGTEAQATANSRVIPITYPDLVTALQPGNTLLISDADLILKIKTPADSPEGLTATVEKAGTLKNGMIINAPDVDMNFPPLTPKDKADLAFALEHGFEIITQSFPASDADVEATRQLIREQTDANPMLIAKIERPQSVAPDMLRRIARTADALMVARGDLGTEMGVVRLPRLQHRIIQAAKAEGKQVVVANKLLGSMTHRDLPGRSDVFDMALAVREKADMVMLTGETASGEYPVEAVAMADTIIREYESVTSEKPAVPPVASSNIYDEIITLVRQIIGQVQQLLVRVQEVVARITRR